MTVRERLVQSREMRTVAGKPMCHCETPVTQEEWETYGPDDATRERSLKDEARGTCLARSQFHKCNVNVGLPTPNRLLTADCPFTDPITAQ